MENDKNYIYLKRGNINEFSLPVDCESYKAIEKLERLEEALREWKGGGRREHRNKDCLQLAARAILNAPKNCEFWNDFTDTVYTKEKALDYIINYEYDY